MTPSSILNEFVLSEATGTTTFTYAGNVTDGGEDSHAREEFDALTAEWVNETQSTSSLEDIKTHPSYLRIIGKGKSVLPFIFEDLRRNARHWFPALKAITGTSPINPKDAGKLREMTEAWLRWGEQMGYGRRDYARFILASTISSAEQFHYYERTDYGLQLYFLGSG